MARQRKEPKQIKLKHPDRSGPAPGEQTLLDLAMQRNLFAEAEKRQKAIRKKATSKKTQKSGNHDISDEDDEDEATLSPAAERVLETLLWTSCISMLHFTLDVLVHHQYSIDRIVWPKVWLRFGQSLLVFGLLVYTLHPHASKPTIVPGIPLQYQSALRQAIFFACSLVAGCYMIYITNSFGYMAVMKQAPPLGCLWVWSVIELELPWAVLSLAGAGTFLWSQGYDIK
ncbi:hypothetical protein QBC35DRAFT_241422 [Podospora australis]|uniref:DUF7719 domain-containing protein n=1 Tax=Podospora australis TaxID=1536484 RepID=A0AAN6WS50_9PEZI|nr:hypothetical protein QBC35DRAFT_241422 [Podospora australis]